MILKQKTGKKPVFCFGDPNGIRTHDTTVKGWCLNRLTMGPRSRFGFWLATTLCVIAALYAKLLLFAKKILQSKNRLSCFAFRFAGNNYHFSPSAAQIDFGSGGWSRTADLPGMNRPL